MLEGRSGRREQQLAQTCSPDRDTRRAAAAHHGDNVANNVILLFTAPRALRYGYRPPAAQHAHALRARARSSAHREPACRAPTRAPANQPRDLLCLAAPAPSHPLRLSSRPARPAASRSVTLCPAALPPDCSAVSPPRCNWPGKAQLRQPGLRPHRRTAPTAAGLPVYLSRSTAPDPVSFLYGCLFSDMRHTKTT